MQVEFERLIQLIDPEYTVSKKVDSDTIFYFLNSAQDRYIKQNYLAIDSTRGTLENLKKNTDAFKSLIVTSDLNLIDDIGETENYSVRAYLPDTGNTEFFLYLRSSSTVHGTYMGILEGNKAQVPNKFITQEDVDAISVSYYNKPILRQPMALIEADIVGKPLIRVFADTYTTISGISCTYIRKPAKITVHSTPSSNCELSTNVHQEIVDLAVSIFIEEAAFRLNGGANKGQQQEKARR